MRHLLRNISLLLFCSLVIILSGCEDDGKIKEYVYPVPSVSEVTPSNGYGGSLVTINGLGFGEYAKAVKVYFGGVLAAEIISCVDNQIVVKAPQEGISGDVTLQVWTNVLEGISTFTFKPSAKIISVDKERVQVGDIVTVSGENFGVDVNATHVYIAGVEASVISVTNAEIKFMVPEAKSGTLVVTVDGQEMESIFLMVGDELLTGVLIGHSGSWGNNPATFITAAVDGDITTFVDGLAKVGFVGYDLGISKAAKLTSVRYVPRASHPQRMVGGEIRGANDPTLSDYVTLYKIEEQPSVGVYTEVEVSTEEAFRYIYYYSPDGYCNIAEIEFYGSIVDAVIPEGKYVFEFDDPISTDWIPQQNSTYVIENSKLKVTFDPVQFVGTSKRRADLKFMNTPWIYTKEYPIMAIKFTKPEVVAFRPDVTGLDSGFSNNDYKKDFETQNVYYWDLSEKTSKDRVECGVFQFKIPDITSAETGYQVDWVRTFKTKEALQSFLGQ